MNQGEVVGFRNPPLKPLERRFKNRMRIVITIVNIAILFELRLGRYDPEFTKLRFSNAVNERKNFTALPGQPWPGRRILGVT